MTPWPTQIFINDEKWQINTNIDTATSRVHFQVISADPESESVWLMGKLTQATLEALELESRTADLVRDFGYAPRVHLGSPHCFE